MRNVRKKIELGYVRGKRLRTVSMVSVLFVAMLLIPALFAQKAIAAWETWTDRPGMDYKSFWIDKDIEDFVAVKQCEDACEKDSQCKAFTYVKAGVQGANARCYLKNAVPSPVKNTCCTSGVVRPETKADYCNNYALTAVQFSKSNTGWKCGFTGNRWNDNYTLHYNWCMQVQESISKHEADERKRLMGLCLAPSAYTAKGCWPCDSELGDIESDELNGIAHNYKYWFWSSNEAKKPELARTPRSSFYSVDKYQGLPTFLTQKGYNHFGDIDFHDNLLYAPVTGGSGPIVAVYNENLEFIKYGIFPASIQTDAAWVAINPMDGYLYSHGKDFNKLNVYERDFSNGGILKHIQTVTLDLKHVPSMGDSWWKNAWQQGGAFSKNGIFYLILDHASDEDSEYTGVHAFKLENNTGTELTLKSGSKNFINISYDPDFCWVWRYYELEGITIVDHANWGQIHVIMLQNDIDDDDVYLYHFFVNNFY